MTVERERGGGLCAFVCGVGGGNEERERERTRESERRGKRAGGRDVVGRTEYMLYAWMHVSIAFVCKYVCTENTNR